MTKLIEYALIALGVWLAASSTVMYWGGSLGVVVGVVVGVLAVALAFVGMRSKTVQWNFLAVAGLGLALVAWGVADALVFAGGGAAANEIIVGLLLAALAVVALPFQVDASRATFYNRMGGELARMESITEKKGNLLAKAVLLNSMPETIFIRPDEICKMISLIDFKVVVALPKILYAGWKVNREEARRASAGEE